MIAKTIALILLTILSGCDKSRIDLEMDAALTDYSCTVEQHSKVEHEAVWCANNANFLSSHCYEAAIIRNCAKRDAP